MRSLVFIILITITSTIQGQWSLSVNSENGYSNNIFANYHQLSDYFSSLRPKLTHDWISENSGTRLYYQVDMHFFKQFRERNSQTHEIGFDHYKIWGDQGNRFDFGVNADRRYHSDSYQWYEQNQYQVYATIKYVPRAGWYTYFGAMWLLRDYPMLPSFSQQRSQLYVRNSLFFPTNTTLILEADLMSKAYTSATTGGMADDSPEVVSAGSGASRQVLLLARTAQSISSRIGISAEYQLRLNSAGSNRYLNNGDGFYYSDEEIFEDMFAYHGSMWTAGYNQHLPWSMRISLNGSREIRQYDDRPAADLQGEPFADGRLRSDRRTMAWLTWSKRLTIKNGWSPLNISLTYSWLENDSNDPFYNYNSTYWGLRLVHTF